MMTSSNGNIFRVTGPSWGEITGHRWIPLTKATDTELWCYHWSAHEQTVEQTIMMPLIRDPSRSLWPHCNVNCVFCYVLKKLNCIRDNFCKGLGCIPNKKAILVFRFYSLMYTGDFYSYEASVTKMFPIMFFEYKTFSVNTVFVTK